MRKKIMIVIDGMDDIEYSDLGEKTPYNSGKTNGFIEIENHAVSGYFKTIPDGFLPDTMVGMSLLLGVDSKQLPLGRSYLEAISNNISLTKNDLVLRGNYISIDGQGEIKNAFVKPSSEVIKTAKTFFKSHNIEMHYIGAYRNIFIAKSNAEVANEIKSNPPHQNIGAQLKNILPTGNLFAQELSRLVMGLHHLTKPFTVFPWAPSVYTSLPKLPIKAAMINGTDVVCGIAEIMGIKNIKQPSFTGDTNTNLRSKAELVVENIKKYPLVIAHIGGTDEATHRKNHLEKATFINKIDKEFIQYILKNCSDSTEILVTSDHGAYCKTGGHSAKPVKFLLYRKNLQPFNIGIMQNIKPYEITVDQMEDLWQERS